jgi:hypothetical protein
MHLIGPLASGVNGAASGFAYVRERNSASLATCYSDYQGTLLSQPASGFALDGNGGIVVYVNEEVDVVVTSVDGTQVRAFTEMNAAPLTEVRSLSFTGVDYTTAASAPGNPTDLQTVLDGVRTSFGSTDWNVLLPDGTTSTIQSALAGTANIFINVKDGRFGAIGDGVVDDTVAIQAAITYASTQAGGIVVFPVGIYRTTAALNWYPNIHLWGITKAASIITLDSATENALECLSGTSSGYQEIRNLSIIPLVPNSGSVLSVQTGTVRAIALVNSTLGSSDNKTAATIDITTTGTQHVLIDESVVAGAQGGVSPGFVVTGISATTFFEMRNSSISGLAGTAVGLTGLIACINLNAVASTFQIVSTAGAPFAVGFTGDGGTNGPQISLIGNRFLAGAGSAGYALINFSTFDYATTTIVESGNVYQSTFANILFLVTGGVNSPKIQLDFLRYSGHKYAAANATPFALETTKYGIIWLGRTTTANQTLTATTMPVGSKLKLMYENGSGGPIAVVTLDGSNGFEVGTPTFTLNAGQIGSLVFTSIDPNGTGAFWSMDAAIQKY